MSRPGKRPARTALPKGPVGHLKLARDIALQAEVTRDDGNRCLPVTLVQAISAARRMTFGPRLMGLVESLRTSDLGVTITSFHKAAKFKRSTWLEWNARIPGGGTNISHGLELDRMGALVDPSSDGQRGTLTFIMSARRLDGRGAYVKMLPLAATFDWSAVSAIPPSLFEPPTAAQIAACQAALPDPTPAMLDGQPTTWAEMCRHVGIVENPMAENALVELRRHGGDVVREMIDATVEYTMTVACLGICLATVRIISVDVRPGSGRLRAVRLGYRLVEAVQ